MTTYETVQNWLQQKLAYKLPALDKKGLSRCVINEKIILHILADPTPSLQNADSLFLYVPLIDTALINNDNAQSLLYFVGEQNMMGVLPAGFRLALNKDTNFFWLVGRFSTNHMTFSEFETCIKDCITFGETIYVKLRNIIYKTEATTTQNDDTNMTKHAIWG